MSPSNIAFRNNLLVPYHDPLKLGLLENRIALPEPIFDTINETVLSIFLALFSVIKPSINGLGVYLTTDEYSFLDGLIQL